MNDAQQIRMRMRKMVNTAKENKIWYGAGTNKPLNGKGESVYKGEENDPSSNTHNPASQ